jgi:cytochrome c oxidase cbb3-type subunit I/II
VSGAVPETFRYDDDICRKFAWATVVWGLIGMLVGLLIAVQLYTPLANFTTSWLSFGRLRPLHTNAVVFAFCGNAIFAGIYHSSQRLLKTRMWSDVLSRVHFWGWQAIIVAAALTLPLGLTTSKEYAELEWPIDLAITVVWLTFALNFFMTLRRRREQVLYVSIWFYISTIVAIAMLHVVNSLGIPVTLTKSYPIYTGIQDALVQWWYGHNAVAFFLTTPFLGLAYYYIPKAAGRPIYSYRLSILHFWSLIFLYIWAGPHHLQHTALPVWLQSLGMVFSVMLVAPSWGGGINFLLTLKNAWSKLKTDPVLKFFLCGVTFYMMATFEGPLLSIKAVNAISHNTDWTIAHVHSGALGWNGFLAFGMLYWLLPRLQGTELHSQRLAHWHFWLGTLGILVYIVPMYVSGVVHATMANAVGSDSLLVHPSFIEIARALIPLQLVRAVGGSLYLAGVILMTYNLVRTAISARAARLALGKPACFEDTEAQAMARPDDRGFAFPTWSGMVENWPTAMTLFVLVAVAAGGILELVPALTADDASLRIAAVKPYTPLELEGRDIYIREGCVGCHTQMIRTLPEEVLRYGPHSQAGEFVYDTPHLWGSKRTGPDLHRVGGKYGDAWHYRHLVNPRALVEGSVMPAYPWLAETPLESSDVRKKMVALQRIGVPYLEGDILGAPKALERQSRDIVARLKEQGETNAKDATEMVALIAYLQRLGTDLGKNEATKEVTKEATSP